MMDRRRFLKSLAAVAGITVIPSLGIKLPQYAEPIKWIVEEHNYSFTLAVAGQWGTGSAMVRHAVQIDMFTAMNFGMDKKKSIAYCKQMLRQWYCERHGLRKAA